MRYVKVHNYPPCRARDKWLQAKEPLGVISFGRFSVFLCYFQLIDLLKHYKNLSIENSKGKQKIFEIILLPMALLPATICPPYVKNVAWCSGRPLSRGLSTPKGIAQPSRHEKSSKPSADGFLDDLKFPQIETYRGNVAISFLPFAVD